MIADKEGRKMVKAKWAVVAVVGCVVVTALAAAFRPGARRRFLRGSEGEGRTQDPGARRAGSRTQREA